MVDLNFSIFLPPWYDIFMQYEVRRSGFITDLIIRASGGRYSEQQAAKVLWLIVIVLFTVAIYFLILKPALYQKSTVTDVERHGLPSH